MSPLDWYSMGVCTGLVAAHTVVLVARRAHPRAVPSRYTSREISRAAATVAEQDSGESPFGWRDLEDGCRPEAIAHRITQDDTPEPSCPAN